MVVFMCFLFVCLFCCCCSCFLFVCLFCLFVVVFLLLLLLFLGGEQPLFALPETFSSSCYPSSSSSLYSFLWCRTQGVVVAYLLESEGKYFTLFQPKGGELLF